MAKPFSALPGDARKLSLQVEKGSVKALRQAAGLVLSNVVQRSPVDTGRLRANWQVGVGSAPSGTSPGGDPLSSGGSRINSVNNPDATIYISNNVRYINFVNGGIRGNEANAGFIQAAVQTAISQSRNIKIIGGR
jgi:hypothetical protein